MGFVFFRPRPPEPPYDYSAVKDPCPHCRHEKSEHPRPGQTNLTRCVICIWEEDTDQRETEDMCALRFGEPLTPAPMLKTSSFTRALVVSGLAVTVLQIWGLVSDWFWVVLLPALVISLGLDLERRRRSTRPR